MINISFEDVLDWLPAWVRLEGEPEGPEALIRDDFRVFNLGGGWGNKISFSDWQGRRVERVHGFKSWPQDKVRNGDLLKTEMQSGKVLVWVFDEVEYQLNPSDMFFADVVFLAEEDDIILREDEPYYFNNSKKD